MKPKEELKSKTFLLLPYNQPQSWKHFYLVLRILGHEPLTMHTRTPPTEEPSQPQPNTWGVSLAKDFSVGKCRFVANKAFCGKLTSSTKYQLEVIPHSGIAWQGQADPASLLGSFCTSHTLHGQTDKHNPLQCRRPDLEEVFDPGLSHWTTITQEINLFLSQSFFKRQAQSLCHSFSKREQTKRRNHQTFHKIALFPLSSFNTNYIISLTLGIDNYFG